MKILHINKYLYPKGGDAIVCLETGKLFASRGHDVSYWGMANDANPDYVGKEHLLPFIDYGENGEAAKSYKQAVGILYNREANRLLDNKIRKERPDIVHLHNYAHQISPSILHVINEYKIPAVMTMHDYKLVCASYALLSDGKICDKCKNSRYYNCLLEKCVKNSRAKSLLNTIEMYLHHNIMHIYDLIDTFIAPSDFIKNKVKEMGFKGTIAHLPNFISTEEYIPKYECDESSIVYFGRLSREKGLFTLIEAMRGIPGLTLKIVGEGPIKENLISKAESLGLINVKFLGYKRGDALKDEIKKSMFAVVPSEWYENNPRAVIESFALGKPVVAARIGGLPELVSDNINGITFESGNPADLREKIKRLMSNPESVFEMGRNARRYVEEELNSGEYYEKLMEIYAIVIADHGRPKGRA